MTEGRPELSPGDPVGNGHNDRNIFSGYIICGIDIKERSGKALIGGVSG